MKQRSNLFLTSDLVNLVIPSVEHANMYYDYLQDNREHFRYSSPKHIFNYDYKYWETCFERCKEDFKNKNSLALFIFDKSDDQALLGDLKFDGVARGIFQSCYLGYRLDKAKEGQGLMYHVLNMVIPYFFEQFKIHRIMANYRVDNHRSGALLNRLGFVQEGLAKDYLFLDGEWCDHILNSLVNKNYVMEI